MPGNNEFDLEELTNRANVCLGQLGSGGPAATRFCAEVKKLLSEIATSKANSRAAMDEIRELECQLKERREEVKQTSLALKESNERVNFLRKENISTTEVSKLAETSTETMKAQIKEMVEENERLQAVIDKGPGWTTEQEQERDKITEKIELERSEMGHTQNELLNVRQKMNSAESKLHQMEKLREEAAFELEEVERRIEAANSAKYAKQGEINEIENQVGALELQLHEAQEDLSNINDCILQEKKSAKYIAKKTKDDQLEIEKSCRDFKEWGRKIVSISSELERQHQTNIDTENENVEKLKLIQQRHDEARDLATETEITEKKKELISEKITQIEGERVKNETERDELKMKLNKIGTVEVKMIAKELDAQKRQLETLQRELDLLERKKNLTEKSSTLIKDVISSNESTLKNLQNELSSFCKIAKQNKDKIVDLQELIKKEHKLTETVVRKRRETMEKLEEKELSIGEMQKKLEISESARKQKQSLCDTIKSECNVQSKKLTENQEELERAKRELNVINRQIHTLHVDITRTENDLVMEHYNHHRTDEEKETLKVELEDLKLQISDVKKNITDYKSEISQIEHLIKDQDRECEKYVKEYSVLVSERDILGSLLVQKNAELEKVHEKIKGQRSILYHGELQYSDLIASITEHVTKLKDLLKKKAACADFERINDELILEAHALENEIHRDKLKTTALREELSRPINIHRWRALEHRDPKKFDDIQRIQRLQKQIIGTAESITEKDAQIREHEREYLAIKRIYDQQPQLSEVQEQLTLHESNLSEKLDQMKQIEFEITVQKRRVNDLTETINELEIEEHQINQNWINLQASQDETCSTNSRT